MGAKTQLGEELRNLGPAQEGAHVQRHRPGPHGAVPHTLISGQKPHPGTLPAPAARQHVLDVQQQQQRQQRSAGDRWQELQRSRDLFAILNHADRAFRDAGLRWDATGRAYDLVTEHGTRPEDAIRAVGGARMTVQAAREIERALLPPNNPNDDRAYHRALDLHAQGTPVVQAILQANHEEAEHRRNHPHLRVQEFFPGGAPRELRLPRLGRTERDPRPAPLIPPPPPPRAPRGFPQTASQRRQNRQDNVVAGVGVAVLLAAFGALAWVTTRPKPPEPLPPPQSKPPVKPPARSSQPPAAPSSTSKPSPRR